MSDDLFSEVHETPNTSDTNYLAALVGDDKKFKTVDDLARGKAESDRYIQELTSKLDELRTELNTKTSMQEMLDQLKASNKPQDPDPSGTPVAPVQTDTSSLEEQLETLLAQREAKKVVETNMDRVKRVLNENFNDQATVAINNKAKQLGLSVKRLQEIAADAPQAFFNLMGIQEDSQHQPSGVAVPRSSVNSTGTPAHSAVRNAAYYEKMKRENPKAYFDPKTTVQQIKDRTALGAKYYT